MANIIESPEGVKVKATKNIDDLIISLIDTHDKHQAKLISDQEAATSALIVGKIFSGLALKLKYNSQRKEIPDIKFLNK